ncbi:hypothetical protein B0H66DRAFT_570905 [Apodospora peruviana]|uniref:Uncharacterized protein n=1 Tax=Apodospora peruviana TaxID=516989 RepID=A0AAE0HTT2_9PEZI|nr:hypothetical protein B0H66DRAFT_570905 [Apodospora peruviana]
MSRERALKLLQKNLKSDQISDTRTNEELLEFLASLPLEIRPASAYMAKKRISDCNTLGCASLVTRIYMIELLGRDFKDRHRYKSIQYPVATTWLVSFRHILDYDPLATDFLRFMYFLAGKDIRKSLLPPATSQMSWPGPMQCITH